MNCRKSWQNEGGEYVSESCFIAKKVCTDCGTVCKVENLTLSKALGIFYHSDTYELMSKGISDMHCMSDGYLVEKLQHEYRAGKGRL